MFFFNLAFRNSTRFACLLGWVKFLVLARSDSFGVFSTPVGTARGQGIIRVVVVVVVFGDGPKLPFLSYHSRY